MEYRMPRAHFHLDLSRPGPLVSTPIGGRYHPALIAQASATIDIMYRSRFVLGVSTGEAVNDLPS
jgi:coenzyme F420-dependent glucose-6-phosphate dehydrogenase